MEQIKFLLENKIEYSVKNLHGLSFIVVFAKSAINRQLHQIGFNYNTDFKCFTYCIDNN